MCVHPVLTAHPTEVQRKSTLDCQLAIAEGLARIDSADALPEEIEAATGELRRLVATLWQTRMIRAVKLGVRDEIENALAYFHYTFLDALPAIVADVEDRLALLDPRAPRPDLPPLVAVGSWVSTLIVAVVSASTLPAASTARTTRMWAPSARLSGPEYVVYVAAPSSL